MTDETVLTLEEEDDFVVTIDDVRRFHCARGARRWFEGGNAAGISFDFRDFVRNGCSAKALLETGDALATKVVTAAWRARQDG